MLCACCATSDGVIVLLHAVPSVRAGVIVANTEKANALVSRMLQEE